MPNETPCPAPETVQDLLANRLPAAEAEPVRRHVAGCARCQRAAWGAPAPPVPAHPYLAAPLAEGELGSFAGYRIRRVLGEGGMATVFEAEDPALHREIALKVMRPEVRDEGTRQRFLQEARLMAGLPDEHVVHVYQVGEAEGLPFLAMERLKGQTLEARLKRDRTLPLAEALAITREAAEGLEAAHAHGLVHRDVKPGNIWLESSAGGAYRRVKLLDFGVARVLNADARLTALGQVLGTPQYMSPEQAAGLEVDGRADLYSLGCVLFRALVGRAPFEGSTREQTMAFLDAVIKGDAPSVSDAAPHLPGPVAALIQRLLARSPGERPASAAALVQELRRLEAEECGPPAAGAAVIPPTRGRAMRRPAVVGIIIGAGAILAALVIGAVVGYQRLTGRDPAGAGEERRR